MRCWSLSSVRACFALAILASGLVLLQLPGCGTGETVVIVSIHGLTSDVSKMAFVVRLNSQVIKSFSQSPPVTRIGLRLAEPLNGALEVGVGGGNRSGCLVSLAVGRAQVRGEPELRLAVMLEYLPEPDCQ